MHATEVIHRGLNIIVIIKAECFQIHRVRHVGVLLKCSADFRRMLGKNNDIMISSESVFPF